MFFLKQYSLLRFILTVSLLAAVIVSLPAQPAEIEWLPVIKTAKDQRTLALLKAGSGGFYLLRWQERRADAGGNTTPAMPLLTVLTPGGERLHDEPLPGFADGSANFRFALANDSVLLVVYESAAGAGPTLYARRLRLDSRQWSAAPEAVFKAPAGKTPAFDAAWFSRSADGSHWCCYHPKRLSGGRLGISVAVFDAAFRPLWKREVELPAQAGPQALRSVWCANNGAVVLHTRIFTGGSIPPGALADESPAAYSTNGQAPFRRYDADIALPAHTDALYLFKKDDAGPDVFYPQTGKKFTPSLELGEDETGKVYVAGLASNEGNGRVEAYFVYTIETDSGQGQMLQNAPLPAAARKLFLSEKAAAKKEPVENIALRRLLWAGDGKPWLLVERENFAQHPKRIEEAALFRLDSAFRITAARKMEKFQNLPAADPQNFASVAACAAPKGAWWLLWNQGSWPDTKLMLTECRTSGEPEDFQMALATRTNVALLPQTLMQQGDKWYFVGESEYHERIRIGVVKAKK